VHTNFVSQTATRPTARRKSHPRLNAEDRREAVIQAAVVEFARSGYFGTSTEAVAARAGISQPYVFRLFGNKRNLFLVTAQRCFGRILETFRAAAATAEGDPFPVMGEAYMQLLTDRQLLMLWMHAFAACADPAIQSAMAAGFQEMFEFLEGLPGATPEKIHSFVTKGMFLNVAAATNMRSAMTDDEWARRCLAP
jgi:AcrR family transcriptional regulator